MVRLETCTTRIDRGLGYHTSGTDGRNRVHRERGGGGEKKREEREERERGNEERKEEQQSVSSEEKGDKSTVLDHNNYSNRCMQSCGM